MEDSSSDEDAGEAYAAEYGVESDESDTEPEFECLAQYLKQPSPPSALEKYIFSDDVEPSPPRVLENNLTKGPRSKGPKRLSRKRRRAAQRKMAMVIEDTAAIKGACGTKAGMVVSEVSTMVSGEVDEVMEWYDYEWDYVHPSLLYGCQQHFRNDRGHFPRASEMTAVIPRALEATEPTENFMQRKARKLEDLVKQFPEPRYVEKILYSGRAASDGDLSPSAAAVSAGDLSPAAANIGGGGVGW